MGASAGRPRAAVRGAPAARRSPLYDAPLASGIHHDWRQRRGLGGSRRRDARRYHAPGSSAPGPWGGRRGGYRRQTWRLAARRHPSDARDGSRLGCSNGGLPADTDRRRTNESGCCRARGLARSGRARPGGCRRRARAAVREPPGRSGRRDRAVDRRMLLRGWPGCPRCDRARGLRRSRTGELLLRSPAADGAQPFDALIVAHTPRGSLVLRRAPDSVPSARTRGRATGSDLYVRTLHREPSGPVLLVSARRQPRRPHGRGHPVAAARLKDTPPRPKRAVGGPAASRSRERKERQARKANRPLRSSRPLRSCF